MKNSTVQRKIWRFYETGGGEELEDNLVLEYHLKIRLDGEDLVQVVLSPSLIKEFILGFLLTRGLIQGPQDISRLHIADNIASVKRRHKPKGIPGPFRVIDSTGSKNIDPERFYCDTQKPSLDLRVRAAILFSGLRMLSDMPVYKRTGGTHCAILFSVTGKPLVSAEDIGRHNAVDKCIGGGIGKGIDLGKCWLASSGRLPGDMVLKPAIVGIPLIASVSAATSDGIDMGKRTGVSVVGFCRGNRFNCYCYPERIVQD